MFESQPIAFFVYGTLKRGYLRDSVWPFIPNHIEPACIRARLVDLGPYPAIQDSTGSEKDEWVLGELWSFDPVHMPATIAALDEAEGFNQLNQPNYYLRKLVQAHTSDNRAVNAFAYFMPDGERLESARSIPASLEWNNKRCAAWPDPLARVPKSFAEEEAL